MRIVYEEKNTATTFYIQTRQKNVRYKARAYICVGRSTEKREGVRWRLDRLTEVIGKMCLAILLVPLVSERFRDSLKNSLEELVKGHEIVQHCVLAAALPEVQRKLVKGMVSQLKEGINELGDVQFRTAKCFAQINCEKGQIRKEFIIRKQDDVYLTPYELHCQINRIEKTLASELKESLGPYKVTHLFMMMKDEEGPQFYQAQANDENGRKQGQNSKLAAQDLEKVLKQFAHQTGFPVEVQWQNNAFVPGAYYQNLEAAV